MGGGGEKVKVCNAQLPNTFYSIVVQCCLEPQCTHFRLMCIKLFKIHIYSFINVAFDENDSYSNAANLTHTDNEDQIGCH